MSRQLNGTKLLESCVSGFLILAMTLITFVSSTSANDEDLVKKLVGKWEGTVAIKDPFRTLVIDSVKRDGDQWIATGRWGRADKKGNEVQVKIQVTGENLSLAFDAAEGNQVHLKLVGDRELTGVFRHMEGGKPGVGHRVLVSGDASLKKVD